MPSTTVGIPTVNNYPTPTYQFNNPKYLFEECVDDAYSLMMRGSDPLQQWIPVEAKNNLNEWTAHYSYIVPEGFDGSQSPLDWMLDGDEIGLCEYHPGGMTFDICQYFVPYQRFTFSTADKPITMGAKGGMQYCNTEPRGYSRGDEELMGLSFVDDKAWVLSGMMLRAEDWFRQVLRIGTIAGANKHHGNNDGLESVLTAGYVDAHKAGIGSCVGENPEIFNALDVTDAIDQIEAIVDKVELILARAIDMGSPLTPTDIAVRINPVMWKYLVENAMATGDFYARLAKRVEFRTTPEYWEKQRNMFMTGGLGYGVLPTSMGIEVPILYDDFAARQRSYLSNGQIAKEMVGEVTIMTRRFRGRNILAQQYMDYRQIEEVGNSGAVIAQNGFFRITENDYNKTCYIWNMESQWRFVSRMQRLQGRVLNLRVPVRATSNFESVKWAHPNFYAYEGQTPYGGNPLLVPLDFN